MHAEAYTSRLKHNCCFFFPSLRVSTSVTESRHIDPQNGRRAKRLSSGTRQNVCRITDQVSSRTKGLAARRIEKKGSSDSGRDSTQAAHSLALRSSLAVDVFILRDRSDGANETARVSRRPHQAHSCLHKQRETWPFVSACPRSAAGGVCSQECDSSLF